MNPPFATALVKDPRVTQAKDMLLATVHEYQKNIREVRPPDPQLSATYDMLLSELGDLRAGKTYFPFLGSGLGNGALVELLDGSVKYDFISGIGVHYFGHSHRDIISACIDAAIMDTVMQGNLQQNADTLGFTNDLVEASGLDHCFLTSSGAMANENALKLAFQHHQPASRILAFDHCFMGRTLALSQVTDKAQYRAGLPLILGVDYIPYFNAKDPEGSTEAALAILKHYLVRYPKQHAMMVFELVQGEGGFYPGSAQFFRKLMTVCKENNIAVIADEVQTFGRLPKLFAFQYFEVQDLVDIVTIGKLSQLCATLFKKDYLPRPGLLSQTFTASTAAIRAGHVILKHLVEKGYFGEDGKIAQIGKYTSGKLDAISQRHPTLLQGPYGIGAMVAFTPLGGDPQKVARFVHNLFHAGVISFTAGVDPMRVRFLVPAGAVTFADIDAVADLVEQSLVKTAEESINNAD